MSLFNNNLDADFGKYHSNVNNVDYKVVGNISQKSDLPKINLQELILPENKGENNTGLDGFEKNKTHEDLNLSSKKTVREKDKESENTKLLKEINEQLKSLKKIKATGTKQSKISDTPSKTRTKEKQQTKLIKKEKFNEYQEYRKTENYVSKKTVSRKIKGIQYNDNGEIADREEYNGIYYVKGKPHSGKREYEYTDKDGNQIKEIVKYDIFGKRITDNYEQTSYHDNYTITKFRKDNNGHVFEGYCEKYKDENGIERVYEQTEIRNIENGSLFSDMIVNRNNTEGTSEAYEYFYNGNSAYVNTNRIRTYTSDEKIIKRWEAGYMDEGEFIKDENRDYISVCPLDRSKSNDEIPTSAITNGLPNDESLKPDNINTDIDDILEAGGKITHNMTINGVSVTKTEFAKKRYEDDTESNGIITYTNSGYTKTNEDGKIIEYYDITKKDLEIPLGGSEYFKEHQNLEKIVNIIKYDENTGLHYGKGKKYKYEGTTLKSVTTYYMQGDMKKGMRYTEVEKDENGKLIPTVDYVKFKSNKKIFTDELLPYTQE